MAVSVEAFLQRYPEFSSTSGIALVLDDATLEVSQRVWGNLYEQGVYALTAHILYSRGALDGEESDTGAPRRSLAGESADGISISYGSANTGLSGEFGTYDTSSYGQRYLELRAKTRRHILVTR